MSAAKQTRQIDTGYLPDMIASMIEVNCATCMGCVEMKMGVMCCAYPDQKCRSMRLYDEYCQMY